MPRKAFWSDSAGAQRLQSACPTQQLPPFSYLTTPPPTLSHVQEFITHLFCIFIYFYHNFEISLAQAFKLFINSILGMDKTLGSCRDVQNTVSGFM